MTATTPTAAEVRNAYKAAGHTVRISRAGHVEYKRDGKGAWLEGRWVSEYRRDHDGTVML